MPTDVPSLIEWIFDRPQPDWGAVVPWNPEIESATVTHTTDALRVTLTEGTRNLGGFPRGGLVVEVPDLQMWDWGFIEVRARTSDPVQYIGTAFNLREGSGTVREQPYPFEFNSPSTAVIEDGEVHAYLTACGFPPRTAGLGWSVARAGSLDRLHRARQYRHLVDPDCLEGSPLFGRGGTEPVNDNGTLYGIN